MKRQLLIAIVAINIIPLAGCLMSKARIQGGRIEHKGLSETRAVQGQDPKDKTSIDEEQTKNIEFIMPTGTTVRSGTNQITVAEPTLYHELHTDKMKTSFGGAQKNTLGDTIAKLQSLKWITYLGAALLIFGAASAVYPPLKLIVGSVTTSAVLCAVGLGLIILPALVVGHETLIICIGLGTALLYWFAHRHGAMRGELTAVKTFLGNLTATGPPAASPPPAAPSETPKT